MEERGLDYMALYIECDFNKNSLFSSFFRMGGKFFLPVGNVLRCIYSELYSFHLKGLFTHAKIIFFVYSRNRRKTNHIEPDCNFLCSKMFRSKDMSIH